MIFHLASGGANFIVLPDASMFHQLKCQVAIPEQENGELILDIVWIMRLFMNKIQQMLVAAIIATLFSGFYILTTNVKYVSIPLFMASLCLSLFLMETGFARRKNGS